MIPNFLSNVYVDGPYRIGKQQGPFADPNFYLIENLGWGDDTQQPKEKIVDKFLTLEAAQTHIAEQYK